MSGLARRVVEMLGDRFDAPLGSWHDQRAELERRHGSVRAAAAAAGIPRRTWRYWSERIAEGKTVRPKQGTLDLLSGAVRAGRHSDVTADDAVVIRATDRDDPTRDRTLTGAALRLAPGTMQRVARVYAATGDAEAAGAAFLAGVQDQFYRKYLLPPPEDRHDDRRHRPQHDDGDQGDDDDGDEVDDSDEGDYEVYYEDSADDVFGPNWTGYGGDVAA